MHLLLQTEQIQFWMESFGGDTPKPLSLVGTGSHLTVFAAVAKQRRPASRGSSKTLVTRSAKGGFTGRPDALTASSAYTASMGYAMALAFKGHGVAYILAELLAKDL